MKNIYAVTYKPKWVLFSTRFSTFLLYLLIFDKVTILSKHFFLILCSEVYLLQNTHHFSAALIVVQFIHLLKKNL